MSITMTAPIGTLPGTVRLSDGTTLTVLAGGIAIATDQQFRAAVLAGFLPPPNQSNVGPYRWMTIPTFGNWPSNGSITAPDGTSITITAGRAYIPAAWINYYANLGWGSVPGHDAT